ncbi:MAG: fumarylacetoacetate hydrolase family protein [Synergistaceae bacterium]|jgi:acylpyruvate hydrolase|nr:fumarylacetoacetate hydrolase family protein [Synergistaceae bacterium]
MKFVMYRYEERDYRFGLFEDGKILDLNLAYEYILEKEGIRRSREIAAALLPSDSVDFLAGGNLSGKALEETLARFPKGQDVRVRNMKVVLDYKDVLLGAPVRNPKRIICVAHNYHDFIKETGAPIPPEPRIFAKYFNALCGPFDPIPYPSMTKCMGYEAELAFVIGKPARNIPAEKALEYIAGYTILNDISASDLTAMDKQVLRGKTFDNFAPCGPYLVTGDEVGDPGKLALKLWVNDAVLQESNTDQLIYDVPHLLSFLSEVFTVEPGDIVATGTPGGLAKDRKPTAFMRVGDVCAVEFEKLGRIENKIVAG